MNYEETLKDIEKTLGTVPVFMRTLPEDFIIREWPLFKIYNSEKKKMLIRYRERLDLAAIESTRCPYCILFNKGFSQMIDIEDDGLAETTFLNNYVDRFSDVVHVQCSEYDKPRKKSENAREYLRKIMDN